MTDPLLPLSTALGARDPIGPVAATARRLRSLLETRPGTLPWRPEFGVDLDWLAGQPLTASNLVRARMVIEQGLLRWLPDLSVRELTLRVSSNLQGRVEPTLRTTPTAEGALLPWGGGASLDIHLLIDAPSGPVDLDVGLEP